MKYKNEIFQVFIKFTEENDFINENPEMFINYFGLSKNDFYEIFYVFNWLNKFNSSNNSFILEELKKMEIPKEENIIKAMNYLTNLGNNLLNNAEKYKTIDKQLSNNLKKMAKKRIECAIYYNDLAKNNFFNKITPYKFNLKKM